MATLAASAAGLGPLDDPFGLLASPGHYDATGGGVGPPTPPPPPTPPAQPGQVGPGGGPPVDGGGQTGGTTPQPGQQGTGPGGGPAVPSAQYDLNTDPVLQQVNAIAALADQNAQAAALRNREQLLLNYGDPSLAASVLGGDDPYVTAAGQNQESTLAQLLRRYHEGLQNFDETLDPSLAYSGARIRGEGQMGQTYQDSLAQAAAGLQTGLGSITDQLNAALEADNAQRAQALADAYARAVAEAQANPPAASSKPKTKPKKGGR